MQINKILRKLKNFLLFLRGFINFKNFIYFLICVRECVFPLPALADLHLDRASHSIWNFNWLQLNSCEMREIRTILILFGSHLCRLFANNLNLKLILQTTKPSITRELTINRLYSHVFFLIERMRAIDRWINKQRQNLLIIHFP